MAGLAVLTGSVIVLDLLVKQVERRLCRWKSEDNNEATL